MLTQRMRNEIIALYDGGMSFKCIASHLGLASVAVQSIYVGVQSAH